MKKLSLFIFLSLLWCGNAYAKPMWKISDKWTCEIKLHTQISVDGEVKEINEGELLSRAKLHYYDFKKGIATSAYSDSNGIITKKSFNENIKYKQNIITIDWSGWGEAVSVITQQKGEFWDSASSGFNSQDKVIWTSHSKCWVD
tara:strand:+ start:43 stop:474 length:432 start_codon:yes stop_codon:yes gene_type:complete